MAYRSLVWAVLALGIAVSCSGDPSKKVVRAEDAGAGGEGGQEDNGSGGSMVTPQAGMPGAAAEAGAGGEATSPMVAGGAGGEPSMTSASGAGGQAPIDNEGGAAGTPGAGGETSRSECGTDHYLAYEIGCQECPALPNPDDPVPTAMDCEDWQSASWDGDEKILDLQLDTSIHEAFGGQVNVSWSDGQNSGSGQYDWSFDNYNSILVHIPDASATANSFNVTYLAFEDACGFAFYAQSINVYQDSTWHCGTPPEEQVSACGVGKYESGIDGCFSCPAPPDPNYPTLLGCDNFTDAYFSGYDDTLDLAFGGAAIHEAFDGTAQIAWNDSDFVHHSEEFSYYYEPSSHNFRLSVPTIPDDTDELFIGSLTFTDACGFNFAIAPMTKIYYDGEGGYDIDCGG
jgi:hypothetical protein